MGKWKKRGAQKAARRWRVKALINKFGGRCPGCQCMVTLTHDAPDQATVDHVVPKSKGGSENFSNLQLLCRQCNHAKGDTLLLDDGEVDEDNSAPGVESSTG